MRIVRYIYVIYRRRRMVVTSCVCVLLVLLLIGISIVPVVTGPHYYNRSWHEIVTSDTLRVVTVSSSVTAFKRKTRMMGHEYDIMRQVTDDLGLELSLHFAPSVTAMLDSLRTGRADVMMWPAPSVLTRARQPLRMCGHRYAMGLVVVARETDAPDSSESAIRKVLLTEDSRAAILLRSDSLALQYPDFHYLPLYADSLYTDEQLVEQLALGHCEATVIDEHLAHYLITYYPQLSIVEQVPMSSDTLGWLVAGAADTLAFKIDSVSSTQRSVPCYAPLVKRYYEQSLGRKVPIRYILGKGRISVYDHLFRRYASMAQCDWHMLAAVAFVESRFDPYVTSDKGAKGLMQLMPHTAERFGCPKNLMNDPEASIKGGARLLSYLHQTLRNKIATTKDTALANYHEADTTLQQDINRELWHFILASYNAGMGHIYDAIYLADTLGYDPAVWSGSVEYCLELKNDSAYYTLPCVRLGKFNGSVSTNYVREVLATYEEFCESVP